jgi:alpha-ketoglutarate-dependent taurine dioxygenase
MKVFAMPQGSANYEFDHLRAVFEDHGVILLNGNRFDLRAFEQLTRHFCQDFHQVGTRQALRQADGDGFTTEVFRDNFILLGHAEGTYRPYPPPPEVCFFMCVTPPAVAGGETTLVDGAEFLKAMPADLRNRLEHVGVIYECLWEVERWQAEFGIDTEAELKALLGSFPNIRFGLTDGVLNLFYSTPAITRSRSGTPVFANGVLAHLPCISHPRYAGLPVYVKATNQVYFGDGEPFSEKVVNALVDAHEQVVYRHRWMANEVLIVDNTRYMHGREMTVQPCDRALVSRFGSLRKTRS